ncbi:hypothetical protein SAMN05421890_4879 [Ensifer adhaerens]|nr:hypothetical protein SAMN05421890_4879 [Ensifer adhaerens]
MVPRRRIMEEQQCADTVHVDAVGQAHLHGLAAGDRVADGIAQQWHAGGAILAGLIDGKAAGQTDLFALDPMLDRFRIVIRTRNAGGRRGFRIGLAEFRMVAGTVVAFAVVFPDELPVALFDDGAFISHLGLAQAVRQEVGLHEGAEGGEIQRLVASDTKI